MHSRNGFWTFFLPWALAAVVGAATGHWCFRAGSFFTWVTLVTSVLLVSAKTPCETYETSCSIAVQSCGITMNPQRIGAVGLAGEWSWAVQERLFLCCLFLVVFQQVCISWLLASCPPFIFFHFSSTLLLFWLFFVLPPLPPIYLHHMCSMVYELLEISAGLWGQSWKCSCALPSSLPVPRLSTSKSESCRSTGFLQFSLGICNIAEI